MRPAHFVPETKTVLDLWKDFRRQRICQAIVVDEYGGCAGLVTLGDLLGVLVGDVKGGSEPVIDEGGGVFSSAARPALTSCGLGSVSTLSPRASRPLEDTLWRTLAEFRVAVRSSRSARSRSRSSWRAADASSGCASAYASRLRAPDKCDCALGGVVITHGRSLSDQTPRAARARLFEHPGARVTARSPDAVDRQCACSEGTKCTPAKMPRLPTASSGTQPETFWITRRETLERLRGRGRRRGVAGQTQGFCGGMQAPRCQRLNSSRSPSRPCGAQATENEQERRWLRHRRILQHDIEGVVEVFGRNERIERIEKIEIAKARQPIGERARSEILGKRHVREGRDDDLIGARAKQAEVELHIIGGRNQRGRIGQPKKVPGAIEQAQVGREAIRENPVPWPLVPPPLLNVMA